MQKRIAGALGLVLAATSSLAASPAKIPGPAFPHDASPAALTSACAKNIASAHPDPWCANFSTERPTPKPSSRT